MTAKHPSLRATYLPAVSVRALRRLLHRHVDAVVGCGILLACFAIFRSAPIRQVLDSQYSMLLSENLLRHGDFALDRYHLPQSDYRLQRVGEHRYYSFPIGTSVLSVPFVAVMHLFGVSAVAPDGSYNMTGELRLDARQADTLMAAFAAVVYFTGRLLLTVPSSLVITLVAAFGTQVFSTTSRSMWSDTWGIVLVGAAGFVLLKSAVRRERLCVPLLATLESLAYVVRPTSALVLLGTTIYLAVQSPKALWKFALTASAWGGLFVIYSWRVFHRLLPDYYAADRLAFSAPWSAFLGNLISPSRGLLIYVPAVIGIGLSAVRYRQTIRYRPLASLAVFVVLGHLVILSGFVHWWGGYSYGARLTASLLPWLALLAVIVADAASREVRDSWPPSPADAGLVALVAALCAASIAINAIGAYSDEAQKWNSAPQDIDRFPARLWSWRCPQFLAPFVEPDGPFLPLPAEGLHLGVPDADKYLGRGWPLGEGDHRWTRGRRGSSLRFALTKDGPGVIEIELRPYVAGRKIPQQRLEVSLNGHELGSRVLREDGYVLHRFEILAGVAQKENLLRLRTPDAASPYSVDGVEDRRQLGVGVRVIRWHGEAGRDGTFFPLPTEGLAMGSAGAEQYLGSGWPAGEGTFRWTDGRDGSIVRFLVAERQSGVLELDLRPFVAAPQLPEQHLIVSLNDHEIGNLVVREPDDATHRLAVSQDVLQQENVLRLFVPTAASPFDVGLSPDRRELGVAVRVVRWRPDPE